ncbi:hypothetical protein K440DRAFT_29880 [Wilcoxina mikolae CBS 423.85]|nr:hypothetical protein K440DRAFT_29880 [Wilcoxina mikolae CBS 423.85]
MRCALIRCHCNSTFSTLTHIEKDYSNSPGSYIPLVVLARSIDLETTMTEMIVQSADHKTGMGSVDPSIKTVLLPLLDRPALSLRIQGVALLPLNFTQARSKVKLEIFLNIFGVSEFGELVGKYLSDNKVFLQHPKYPEAGFPYRNPQIISKRFNAVITENTLTGGIPVIPNNPAMESCVVSARPAELLEFFNNIYKSAILDEVCGNWRLKTQLLSHQKQGLYFLQRREQGLSIFDSSTIAVGKAICSKIKGGILADHMGLGKTLTILSLITATLELADTHHSEMEDLLSAPEFKMRSRATLVVTPVSTLGNWEEQIATHVWPGRLRYFVYHGKNRPTDPASLCDYDVVFTTFSIVSQEWKSERDPLHAIDFYRLVLDEAHEIRAEKSQRSRSVCALTSERRWAVTGTPFQNNLTDIATLFKFLKYTPLDTKIGFQNYILATQTGEKSGMDNLRSALKAVCLRRTKATIEADLPQRTEQICFLDFRSDEKELYESHKKKMARNRTHGSASSVADTLRCLSKLRMICDHGLDLLPPENFEGLGCPHRSICTECIELLPGTDGGLSECEECSVDEAPTPEAAPEMGLGRFPNYRGPSTKVNALLQAIINDNTGDHNSPKHVVFSVWTRMLDLVGIALERAGIPFCRLDGSMPRARRDAELKKFRDDSRFLVILISLMAGGVGINLTCASRVHMMEPHWNPMVELQALERVHRLGQTRDVLITRYIIRGSFENNMLACQRKKLELARQSLDAGKAHIIKCDAKKEIMDSLNGILSAHHSGVDTQCHLAEPWPCQNRV